MIDFTPGFTEKYAFFKESAFMKTLGNFFGKEIAPRAGAIGNAFGGQMARGAAVGGAMGFGTGMLNGDSTLGSIGSGILGAGLGGAAAPFLLHGAKNVGTAYKKSLKKTLSDMRSPASAVNKTNVFE